MLNKWRRIESFVRFVKTQYKEELAGIPIFYVTNLWHLPEEENDLGGKLQPYEYIFGKTEMLLEDDKEDPEEYEYPCQVFVAGRHGKTTVMWLTAHELAHVIQYMRKQIVRRDDYEKEIDRFENEADEFADRMMKAFQQYLKKKKGKR